MPLYDGRKGTFGKTTSGCWMFALHLVGIKLLGHFYGFLALKEPTWAEYSKVSQPVSYFSSSGFAVAMGCTFFLLCICTKYIFMSNKTHNWSEPAFWDRFSVKPRICFNLKSVLCCNFRFNFIFTLWQQCLLVLGIKTTWLGWGGDPVLTWNNWFCRHKPVRKISQLFIENIQWCDAYKCQNATSWHKS